MKAGDNVLVLCGAHTRRAATILPYAIQGRRSRTICVRFNDPTLPERWVRPDQIELMPGAQQEGA